MPYIETGGNLDWALKFNRTGTFPLDRSSMFSSYADALAYAKMDGSDSRQIGGTAYIGQLIAVYGPGADGSTAEVSAYIITNVGASATLQKLAQSSATGDYGEDIAALQAAMTEAQADITKIMGSIYSDEEQGTLKEATTSAAGFMSAADKTKLEGIAAGAQVNVIEGVSVKSSAEGDYTPVTIQGKTAQIDLSGINTNITDLQGRMDTAESDIDELQTQVAGLTGAMHFVGTSTTDPTEEGGPTIASHEGEYEAGDVCLYDGKEYIYDGTNWEEFGDEGNHLTKAQADTYYVPLQRTVNGKALTDNITLSATDVGADATGTAAGLIAGLDVEAIEVGPSETIATISETDGVVAATKQSIQIEIAQVTNLQTQLDAKLEESDLPTEFDITANSNYFAAQGGANSVTVNIQQSDSPVTGKLTKNAAGNKLDFGGQISANGTLLTGNTGTVTSVTAGAGLTTGGENDPITGAGTISLAETGAADQSTSNSGRQYVQNITVDDYGRVTAISSGEVPESTDTVREIKVNNVQALDTTPGTALNLVAGDNITITDNGGGSVTIAAADAPVYTGEDGVEVSGTVVSLADNGVTTAKINNGAVTNDKIAAVDVAKLYVAEGDTFILNGGNA